MSGKNKIATAGNGNIGEQMMKTLNEVQGTGKSSVFKKKATKSTAKKPAEEVEDQEVIAPGSVTEMFVARNRKKTGVVVKTTAAPDLDRHVAGNVDFAELTFKVGVVAAPVDAAALQAEAKQRSEQLFGSAAEYYANELMIKELQAISKIELTSRGKELETRIAQKKQFDVRLSKQPKGVQDQFGVDLRIVRNNKVMPTSDQDIIAVFDEVVKMSRARKAEKGENADLYFRDDKDVKHGLVHMKSQMPGREGQVSGADLLIFKSVKGMIWRLRQYKEQQLQVVADALKAKINEIKAMSGIPIEKLFQAVPGVYVVGFAAKLAYGKPVGMPGAAKLEVHIFTIKGDPKPKASLRVVEGAGCLVPTWKAHEKYGHTMPLWWLEHFSSYHRRLRKAEEKGEDIKAVTEFPPNIPEESRDQIQSFLRKLNEAVIQTKKNAHTEPQQQEKPESDLVEAPELEHEGVAA